MKKYYILDGVKPMGISPEEEKEFKKTFGSRAVLAPDLNEKSEEINQSQKQTEIIEPKKEDEEEIKFDSNSPGSTDGDFRNYWNIGETKEKVRKDKHVPFHERAGKFLSSMGPANWIDKAIDKAVVQKYDEGEHYMIKNKFGEVKKVWVEAEERKEFEKTFKNPVTVKEWEEKENTMAYGGVTSAISVPVRDRDGKVKVNEDGSPVLESKPFTFPTAEQIDSVAGAAPWMQQEDAVTAYVNDWFKHQNDGEWVYDKEKGDWVMNGNQRVRAVKGKNRLFAGDEFGKNVFRDII